MEWNPETAPAPHTAARIRKSQPTRLVSGLMSLDTAYNNTVAQAPTASQPVFPPASGQTAQPPRACAQRRTSYVARRTLSSMLRSRMMRWVSKIVVLFVATLVASNAQCATACAFEHCRPAEPPSHCHHHKSTPDRGQPPSAPCPHDLSFENTSAKTIGIFPTQMFAATANAPLVSEAPQLCFHTRIAPEISPPAPSLSSISALRI